MGRHFVVSKGLIIDMTFASRRVNDHNRRFGSRTMTQGKKEKLSIAISAMACRFAAGRFSFVSLEILKRSERKRE